MNYNKNRDRFRNWKYEQSYKLRRNVINTLAWFFPRRWCWADLVMWSFAPRTRSFSSVFQLPKPNECKAESTDPKGCGSCMCGQYWNGKFTRPVTEANGNDELPDLPF